MSKIQRLAGETVLYGLGSMVPRFLSFLLVPLHTNVFAPDAYGIITNVYAYMAVVNILYLFGMETAYFRFASKPGANERRVFHLAQTAVMVISGGLSVFLILLSDPISRELSIAGRPDLVIWLVCIMFVDAVVAIPFARLRLKKKPLRFATGKVTSVSILVLLNILFLKVGILGDADLTMVFLANLLANAFYIIFFARDLLSWRPAFDRSISPAMFHYAYPIMLTGFAGMSNEMFSRMTLEDWLPEGFYGEQSSQYALGVFGACYKLAMLMNLAIQAFRYAAEPFFFSNAAEKNSPQLFARVNHYFILVCCFILVAVSINLDVLKYFLPNPAYWEGLHIVPLLLLAYLLLGVYYNLSVWFKLTDKTYYGTIITFAGVAITVSANYFLIPVAGYTGSAVAAVLCYAGMTVFCYAAGQRYYPIPYQVGSGLLYIALSLALAYGVNAITIDNQIVATAFHLLVLIVFAGCIYAIEGRRIKIDQA